MERRVVIKLLFDKVGVGRIDVVAVCAVVIRLGIDKVLRNFAQLGVDVFLLTGSDFSRYSLRANIEQRAAKWLKVGTNTLLNYQQIELAQSGEYTVVTPISAARFMMPYWNPRRPDGSIASMEDGSWKGEGQNPLEWIENNPVHYKKYKVISSLFAEATPIEGLTIKSQFSADHSHSTGFGISYPEYYPNLGIGTAARNTSDGLTLSVTNTVNYRFRVHEDHSFNFLVGQEGIDYHYESFGVTTQGQNNDIQYLAT